MIVLQLIDAVMKELNDQMFTQYRILLSSRTGQISNSGTWDERITYPGYSFFSHSCTVDKQEVSGRHLFFFMSLIEQPEKENYWLSQKKLISSVCLYQNTAQFLNLKVCVSDSSSGCNI